MLRILAVNQCIHLGVKRYNWSPAIDSAVKEYIDKIEEKDGVKGLKLSASR